MPKSQTTAAPLLENEHVREREKWYVIPDHHPAIVDKPMFEQVQAAIRRFSLPNKKQHDYPVKGKIFCGCCDHALSRVMQKTPFYHCRHSEVDEALPCHNMRIGVDELEQLVFDILQKQMEVLLGMGGSDLSALDAGLARQTEYERQISAIQDSKRVGYS